MSDKNKIADLQKQLKEQILAAFNTANELEGLGVYAMHMVKSGMLSTADALPDKALSHALRASIYNRGSKPEVEAAPQTGFRRNTKAPVYSRNAIAQPQVELAEEPAGEVQDRFTAKKYGATETEAELAKQKPPAAEKQNSEPAADQEGGEVEAGRIFLADTPKQVSEEELRASTAEGVAANFSLPEMKAILSELNYEGAQPRSKAAASKRIFSILNPEAEE